MEDTQPAERDAPTGATIVEEEPRGDLARDASAAGNKALGALTSAGAQVQERASAAAAAAGQTLDTAKAGVGRLT